MNCVDVIVPCYRYGRFLRECVTSVLAQEGVEVRVLIIDDASPDNTAGVATELCRESPKVTFVRHAANKGHIATYNEGIDWISADYYILLSADDYLLPTALARTAALMTAHPEVGLAYGRAVTLDCNGSMIPSYFEDQQPNWKVLPGFDFMKLTGARNLVSTPTAVVRTQLQKQLGGYLPELPHTGDMEMWLRLAAHGFVGVSQAYHAVHREHDSNMSLLYTTNGWLPDLQQREAAIRYFLQGSSDILPNSHKVRRDLYSSLGCEALKWAGDAFNAGDRDMSRRISAFAFATCPGSKRSAERLKLGCKRCLGLRAWTALRPVIRSTRQALSTLRKRWRFRSLATQ